MGGMREGMLAKLGEGSWLYWCWVGGWAFGSGLRGDTFTYHGLGRVAFLALGYERGNRLQSALGIINALA
jgi:hypothetical protein